MAQVRNPSEAYANDASSSLWFVMVAGLFLNDEGCFRSDACGLKVPKQKAAAQAGWKRAGTSA